MIFMMTMFILLMSMMTLIRGNIFYDTVNSMHQTEIDKIDGKEVKGETYAPIVLVFFFAIFYVVLRFIFIYVANDIDILRWPTMIILGYTLANFAWAMRNHESDTGEQKRARLVLKIANAKYRTFNGTIASLTWTVYAGYILWLLMGGTL